jgi:putative flippase GtrA
MKLFIQEALRYSAVSALGFVVDVTILWILVHYFAWGYLWAATACSRSQHDLYR